MYFAQHMKLAVSLEVMPACAGGLVFDHHDTRQRLQVLNKLDELDLRRYLAEAGPGHEDVFALSNEAAEAFVADHDTLHLCATLGLDTAGSMADLEREI